MILRLAISIEHRLVTAGQTDTRLYGIYRASMASRGKHECRNVVHEERRIKEVFCWNQKCAIVKLFTGESGCVRVERNVLLHQRGQSNVEIC